MSLCALAWCQGQRRGSREVLGGDRAQVSWDLALYPASEDRTLGGDCGRHSFFLSEDMGCPACPFCTEPQVCLWRGLLVKKVWVSVGAGPTQDATPGPLTAVPHLAFSRPVVAAALAVWSPGGLSPGQGLKAPSKHGRGTTTHGQSWCFVPLEWPPVRASFRL